ncbi:CotH kinase family protein [Cellulomonas sp. S1-8]|uniref:CotH kinase family protein n=1 Tax=Cellulomonas sp. S1-8 TaxID=2904790 RepID=UPI00224348D3|nr:CotH kinase family protein [Cellulomonas sp. S1-8]UZN01630.1 CotH kinase family protein [Cellulomonas sp. S1-8]
MAVRDLRKRLPVRLRQHWKPLAAAAAGVAVALTMFGDVVIRPYSTSTASVSDEERITQDVAGTTDLFDDAATATHEIVLSYSQDDYDRMLDAYFSDGEKEWMIADLTIDGTTVDSVGIRLKGNSTLSALVDDREGSPTQGERAPGGIGGGGGGPGGPGGELPDGFEPPADGQMPELPEGFELPEGVEPPTGGQMPEGGAPGGGGFGIGTSLSTEQPEDLPLLVSFDEYQPGRAYQGMTEIAVRPASASHEASLNEAVALELTRRTGQPTQDYAYTTYTVNDRPTTTRLVVESADAPYAAALDGDGVLYKVLATSSFTYQGEDQTEYADDFAQVNLSGSQDLGPVVSFLEWLDGASDEEFAAELDEWVDVESFALYLGTQEILANGDSLSGPGRNGYLYYDLETRLISVVSWDLNLALGGMSMPGGFAGAVPGADGAGGDRPAPDDQAMPAQGFAGGPGGMGGNALVSRFEETAEFATMKQDVVAELQARWIDTGDAALVVDEVAARIPVTEGLDRSTIDTEAAAARAALTEAGG